jgi:hypothetical protein
MFSRRFSKMCKTASRSPQDELNDYFLTKLCPANGSVRTRVPVAANRALATAGAIAGTPDSPTPLGGRFDGTMKTSTRGMSAMRSTR